jgi:hypothetical protein
MGMDILDIRVDQDYYHERLGRIHTVELRGPWCVLVRCYQDRLHELHPDAIKLRQEGRTPHWSAEVVTEGDDTSGSYSTVGGQQVRLDNAQRVSADNSNNTELSQGSR